MNFVSSEGRSIAHYSAATAASMPGRPLFVYWGRRGLSRFAFDVARAADYASPFVSVSRENEIHSSFAEGFAETLLSVDTFFANHGVVTSAWRIPLLRRDISILLRRHEIATVIDLMPHAWMPFVLPAIRRAGARYVALAHDADVHPGDYRTKIAKWSMDHCLKHADHVVTLSRAVADRLSWSGLVPAERVSALFHPDLKFGTPGPLLSWARAPSSPIRLAFLGRIMPYKGLSLFVEMVERLRTAGLDIRCGVFGEGSLGTMAARLEAVKAEVVNRWLDEDEIAVILERHDVLVACHTEASQSGIVAAALGAGLPVVATRVGGLSEQVADGITGIIAQNVSAEALADAVQRLFFTPGLHDSIRLRIASRAGDRSMARFAREFLTIAAG
ncbi:glycosyltransferase involved in cell wall biosynthesis [Bradyrhizobium sp. LB7.2]